jgi:hypothetical protein
MKSNVVCASSLAVLLLLGCHSAGSGPSAGPSQSPGFTAKMYVLRTVAGDALPAVLVNNEHVTIVGLADTIWLEPDGSGLEISREQATDKGTGADPVLYRNERPFTYVVSGNFIEVSYECNDVIIRSCVAPPHLLGVVGEVKLVLDKALYYRTPLVFERVLR